MKQVGETWFIPSLPENVARVHSITKLRMNFSRNSIVVKRVGRNWDRTRGFYGPATSKDDKGHLKLQLEVASRSAFMYSSKTSCKGSFP